MKVEDYWIWLNLDELLQTQPRYTSSISTPVFAEMYIDFINKGNALLNGGVFGAKRAVYQQIVTQYEESIWNSYTYNCASQYETNMAQP